VVFKRRDSLPWWKRAAGTVWPRIGWARAFHYVKHRLRRLPDSPRKIARGLAVGVFTTFTPLFGAHFGVAVLLALAIRGNVMAALIGTFFGNPLTYVPIAIVSLNLGHFMLGTEFAGEVDENIFTKFARAGEDLYLNLWASLRGAPVDWSATYVFWHDVFWPWMVGGLVPGVICAIAAYALCLPVIAAYQARRRGQLMRRLEAIRRKAADKAAEKAVAAKKGGIREG
jgi:uncharacterized protein (DUF2062 family)